MVCTYRWIGVLGNGAPHRGRRGRSIVVLMRHVRTEIRIILTWTIAFLEAAGNAAGRKRRRRGSEIGAHRHVRVDNVLVVVVCVIEHGGVRRGASVIHERMRSDVLVVVVVLTGAIHQIIVEVTGCER